MERASAGAPRRPRSQNAPSVCITMVILGFVIFCWRDNSLRSKRASCAGVSSARFDFVDVRKVDRAIRVDGVDIVDLLLFLHRNSANFEIERITDSEDQPGQKRSRRNRGTKARSSKSGASVFVGIGSTIVRCDGGNVRERPARRVSLPRG